MPTWSWILIAAIVIIVIAVAVFVAQSASRRKRSERLRSHYGQEYERLVDNEGGERAAERELVARERRHRKLDIVALTPETQRKYADEWRAVQTGFVDNPSKAVGDADRLVTQVMRERGYPVEDFEERAAEISVDHPNVVEHYRAAHSLHLAQEHANIGTEAQREAFVHYRALFEKLLVTDDSRNTAADHDGRRNDAPRQDAPRRDMPRQDMPRQGVPPQQQHPQQRQDAAMQYPPNQGAAPQYAPRQGVAPQQMPPQQMPPQGARPQNGPGRTAPPQDTQPHYAQPQDTNRRTRA